MSIHPGQVERLISAIEGLTAATERNTQKRSRGKENKQVQTLEEVAGEFTSRPIGEVARAEMTLDEARIDYTLLRWVSDNFVNIHQDSSPYRELVSVVKGLCCEAANGELFVLDPEVMPKV